MARPFDITTTGDTAATPAGGSVRLVFTVTNTTQRPLRGSLRAKAMDSAQAGWLAVVGDAERDFPPGLAHQVELTVAVPAATAPGRFRVRLDALSVANPDDDFTEGPSVAVVVGTAPGPTPKPGLPWWVWLLLGLLLLAVIGVIAWLALRDSAPPKPQAAVIPADLVGKPYDEARLALEKLGLVPQRATTNITEGCPDKVVATLPPAGASAAASSPVTVTVGALAFGPATCRQGFVWREAYKGDTTCVTGGSRAQAQQDNAAHASRVELVPATAKDFDDLQREHPQSSAVAKGDFLRLAPFVADRLVIRPDLQLPMVARCRAPFTERRATAVDRICVTVATQIATDAENQQAAARRACNAP